MPPFAKQKPRCWEPGAESSPQRGVRADFQFGQDLAKLINANINVSEVEPRLIAVTICEILIQLIMATDGRELTFAEAGKIAVEILKTVIKHAKYGVNREGALIDIKTGKEISPGGLKQ